MKITTLTPGPLLTMFLAAALTSVCLVSGQAPSTSPSAVPSAAPTVQAEYDPGNLNVFELDLWLSQGMAVRVIANSGEPVAYSNGSVSVANFHTQPDGAAVFDDERPENLGGYVYISNSEESGENGGVGGIYFDKDGNILEYKMLLTGTSRNCNGGKTLWNTWISCEEVADEGMAWQVDPFGARDPEPITHGSQGGAWETFAHDTRDPDKLFAFLSEDVEDGALQRQTIDNPDYTNPWDILLGFGTVDYLFLKPSKNWAGCDLETGTFEWIDDEAKARDNAHDLYQQSEGMEMIGNTLYLISKDLKGFFLLNLDNRTYTFEDTGFDGQPDQSTTVTQDDGSQLTYFTEEAAPVLGFFGEQVGIYTRNEAGEYVTILFAKEYSSETTGIAFSPDGMRMYFAFQQDGILFEATRTDGLSFFARTAPMSDKGCGLTSMLTSSIQSAWSGVKNMILP